MENVTAVSDDESVFQLKHRVGKEFGGADALSAEGTDGRPEDVDRQQPRAMVVRIRDAELLAQVPEAVVKSTIGHANVVRTHSCFAQYVWTEVMGPVEHAVLHARLVECIEKQSERVGLGIILKSF